MEKCYCRNYVNIDIVFSISGRLRLRVRKNPNNPIDLLKSLKREGMIIKGSFNEITHNFLLEYDAENVDLKKLILNFCGIYSKDIRVNNMKVNFRMSKKNSLGYSAILSLGFIVLDLSSHYLGIGGNAIRYKNFIRWCAVGSTIGAIFEHGYNELNENGAFDPEVMSIMYLFNSINRGTVVKNDGAPAGLYSPAIAWGITFGRHILTKNNQSIMIGTVVRGDEIKVVEENNRTFFFNQFLGSCLDVYQNVSVRRSFLR